MKNQIMPSGREDSRFSWRTRKERNKALGLMLLAASVVGTAWAQGGPPTSTGSHPSLKKADLYGSLEDVEKLSRGLREGVETYRRNLKKAMDIYGRGFYDPEYKLQLAGFDKDIQTGAADQTAKMKLALFATMMWTAGIRLDPDPFRGWADVEEQLNRYQATVDKARELMAQTNVFSAIGSDNIPAEELVKLRSRWRAAAEEVELSRDRARAGRPTKLLASEAFVAQVTEGYNLHFNLLGIEFGRNLGNVTALAQLTYSGAIDSGHVFLLTVISARHGKTRVDTDIKPRSILMHSDSRDRLRYGYAVTMHNYGGYRATGARVADVVPAVRDWIWKVVPASGGATPPAASDLESAVVRVRDSRPAIEQAIDAFQRLASQAVRQNDATLEAEAKAAQRKVRLPEQSLRVLFPGVRAKLYARRALLAGDKRFLAAREAVASARREAADSIRHAREVFGYFNRVPVHTGSHLPWKRIDKLAADLMNAAEEVDRVGVRWDEILPPIHSGDESPFIAHSNSDPGVIVAQVNRGDGLILQYIVRDVHWAVKGIARREYTSELIETSAATGIHQVQDVLGPNYIQGTGGLGQVFRRIMDERQ